MSLADRPGPWTAGPKPRPRSMASIRDANGKVVGYAYTSEVAAAISALPDLLAAAKDAHMWAAGHGDYCEGRPADTESIFDSTEGCTCYLSKLAAAIARAEGREP